MNIKRNLVTPRNGEPIIAATQDFITGCYLITRRDTFFNRQEFTQMCTYLQDAELEITIPPPTILKPERLWTGKQIFNVLMRPNSKSNVNVNLECKNKTMLAPSKDHGDPKSDDPEEAKNAIAYPPFMSVNDGYLVVQNSEIICGVMDKATVGDGNKKSVYAVIQRDFGADEAAACMNRMAKLCARWLGASPPPPLLISRRAVAHLLVDFHSQQGFLDRYLGRHARCQASRREGQPRLDRIRQGRRLHSSSRRGQARVSSRFQRRTDA